MIIIEVESTATAERAGVKEGKPWRMVTQRVIYHGMYSEGFVSKYPRESTIQLDSDNPKPFPVGKYVISAESFYFGGQYQQFTCGRPRLQPLSAFLAEIQEQFKVQPIKAAA